MIAAVGVVAVGLGLATLVGRRTLAVDGNVNGEGRWGTWSATPVACRAGGETFAGVDLAFSGAPLERLRLVQEPSGQSLVVAYPKAGAPITFDASRCKRLEVRLEPSAKLGARASDLAGSVGLDCRDDAAEVALAGSLRFERCEGTPSAW